MKHVHEGLNHQWNYENVVITEHSANILLQIVWTEISRSRAHCVLRSSVLLPLWWTEIVGFLCHSQFQLSTALNLDHEGPRCVGPPGTTCRWPNCMGGKLYRICVPPGSGLDLTSPYEQLRPTPTTEKLLLELQGLLHSIIDRASNPWRLSAATATVGEGNFRWATWNVLFFQ